MDISAAVGAQLDRIAEMIGGPRRCDDESDDVYRPRLKLYNDERLLRQSVGICTMDSWPACYTATLQDEGRTYRASAMGPGPDHVGDHYEAERTVINGIVDKVVAQALEARKAAGDSGSPYIDRE